MAEPKIPNALEVLACEIDVRPVGAPGIDEIAPAILGVERADGGLVVTFARSAADVVQRFVAAEQRCCATISWDMEQTPDAVRLRVGAEAQQIELLERLFAR
jgi:hypothetical protein